MSPTYIPFSYHARSVTNSIVCVTNPRTISQIDTVKGQVKVPRDFEAIICRLKVGSRNKRRSYL